LAGQVTLNAAAPNPFNPTTRISFDLPRQARVSLKIFDATGRRHRRLDSRAGTRVRHHHRSAATVRLV